MRLFVQYGIVILFVPLIAFAQSESKMDRQSFLSLSDSFAYDLGMAYQMGKNCKKDLGNLAASKAESLFFHYMSEQEVQQTMDNYERGMQVKSGMACERTELKAFLRGFRVKIPEYTKAAMPFMRPQVDR